MTTREPRWTEEDQGWALALAYRRSRLCPNCGRDIDECTAPEGEGQYAVPAPLRCHPTTAIAIAAAAQDNPHPEALLFRAERR